MSSTIERICDDKRTFADVLQDAKRWHALMNHCQRIRLLGWAGFGSENHGPDPDHYRHFGAEFWTMHQPHPCNAGDTEQAKKILIAFTDALIAREDEANGKHSDIHG